MGYCPKSPGDPTCATHHIGPRKAKTLATPYSRRYPVSSYPDMLLGRLDSVEEKWMNFIEKFVALEQITMAPILAANGEIFDLAKRTNNIEQSIKRGDRIVSHFKGDDLLGYALIWEKSDREFVITSLQIHPDCRGLNRGLVLRSLACKLLSLLSEVRNGDVVIEAHPTNMKSISLSRKLGFKEVPNSRENRVELRQSISNLAERLPQSVAGSEAAGSNS